MRIRRKRWTPDDGKCCADCDLFTEDSYSGITGDKDGKYGLNIWGTCEVTEKVIDSADKYYCKCFIQGIPYEMRCKMSINSRNKGVRGERQWAEVCQQHGFTDAHRTGQFRGNTGQCADVEGLPYIHQEVKFTEQLRLREAMRQAIRDSKAEGRGNIPIVAHKKKGRPWLVTMTSDDFFEIYRGYLYMQDIGRG